jgi:hypothetical protein
MRVLLSPVANPGVKVKYSFDGEVITATIDNVSDIFDFSGFTEDGEAEGIETTLPINPIGPVKRENGVLMVELANFIDKNATDEEKFPKWVEV